MQQHYGTLLRLKQHFPFSLIDACGTLEQCRVQIARELRYVPGKSLQRPGNSGANARMLKTAFFATSLFPARIQTGCELLWIPIVNRLEPGGPKLACSRLHWCATPCLLQSPDLCSR